MSSLKIGESAPEFSAPDQSNTLHNLAEYKGKKIILVIYVMDGSKGCTMDLANVQKSYSDISQKGYSILGVSKNSVESHARFKEKLGLSFDLLSDPDMKIIKAYDAYGAKGKKDGVEKMGVIRRTIMIDENSKISGLIMDVDVKNSGEQILQTIGN